jgi:putative effector of murein hydrolase
LWSFLFLAALIYCLFRLARSRFRHRGAFLGFILTSAALMYILLISLSAFPYQRYSYTMEFIYYLSPLLIILASMPAPGPE